MVAVDTKVQVSLPNCVGLFVYFVHPLHALSLSAPNLASTAQTTFNSQLQTPHCNWNLHRTSTSKPHVVVLITTPGDFLHRHQTNRESLLDDNLPSTTITDHPTNQPPNQPPPKLPTMPSHPRVEEVEDSSEEDAAMSDPSEDDIDDFADTDILRARPAPSTLHQNQPPLFPPQQQPPNFPQMTTTTDATSYASHQCLYPLYFDASRSRAQGRRVPLSLAVHNPLATEIISACAAIRLPSVFEAGKLHPKDWANPGRVKVDLRKGQHAGQTVQVANKHHLYVLVGKWLVAHPTTEESASLRVVVRGAPPPPQMQDGQKWPRPAVPRGWKMGELLPYYSPAMTGGGVSENFLKDMMKEMGGAGGGAGGDMASMLAAAAGAAGGGGGMLGGGGGSGGGEGKKKEKKKGK